MAEQGGLSFREAERVVETELFLDEYPSGTLGPHTSRLSYTKCSYMLHHEGGKRWNVCATRATKAA